MRLRIPIPTFRVKKSTPIMLFGVGLLIGILLMNFFKGNILLDSGLFDEQTLLRIKKVDMDGDVFFCRLLCHRMEFFLLGGLLATTYLRRAVCYGSTAFAGTAVGLYWAALVIRYGLKGMVLAFIAVFPQALAYVPAVGLFVHWCGTQQTRQVFYFFAVAALIFLGCLLEAYLSPGLLKTYLEYF